MTIDTEARWVERSVQGDLHAFARLVKKPVAVLRDADRRLPRHVLTATAVRHVLSALEHGTASPDLVQRWASFMRRGYIAGARAGPIRPLQIEYEPAAESAIGEILARLDEIGDAIDGDVSTSEVEAMLAAWLLSESSPRVSRATICRAHWLGAGAAEGSPGQTPL